MARVRWIGGARVVPGIGAPEQGQTYDWPDDVAASLVEQGHAERVAAPKAATSVTSPASRNVLRGGALDDEGEE